MKKGFSKLLLAIVMTLQLVPSSMTTIVANDNIAYADDFVPVSYTHLDVYKRQDVSFSAYLVTASNSMLHLCHLE